MESSIYTVYFGSYSSREQPGIHVYQFDENTEKLQFIESVSGLKDPTFIKVDEQRSMLYTFNQAQEPEEANFVTAYHIEPAKGTLTMAGRQPSSSKTATFVQTDRAGNYLLAVSYAWGTVSLLSLRPDGTIGELLQTIQHEGRSILPAQDRPHPHSVYADPSNRFVLVPDLGLDQVIVYKLEQETGKLILHAKVPVAPGSGPRHLAFHPKGSRLVLIQEHSSTVTVFDWRQADGSLEAIQTISTLPPGYSEKSYCAEIQVSRCGRFVYGSNRGHDSIAVFASDAASGRLTPLEYVSTHGKHPRHFSLSPSGRHLFVANKDSDSIQLFRVDPESGRLTHAGLVAEVSQPSYVGFYKPEAIPTPS